MSLAAYTAIKLAGAQQFAGVTCDSAVALRPSQLTLTDVVRAAEAKLMAARRTAAAEAAASAARLLAREALPKLQNLSIAYDYKLGELCYYFTFSNNESGGLTAWLLEDVHQHGYRYECSRLVGETSSAPPGSGCPSLPLPVETQRALREAVEPYLGGDFTAEWPCCRRLDVGSYSHGDTSLLRIRRG